MGGRSIHGYLVRIMYTCSLQREIYVHSHSFLCFEIARALEAIPNYIWNSQFGLTSGGVNLSGYPWRSPKSDTYAMSFAGVLFVRKHLESKRLPRWQKFSSDLSFGKAFGEANAMKEDLSLPKDPSVLQLKEGPTMTVNQLISSAIFPHTEWSGLWSN